MILYKSQKKFYFIPHCLVALETELQQLDFSIFSVKLCGISAIYICINCADSF